MIFIENDKLILEFVRRCKRSGIGKNDFEKEKGRWRIYAT